MGAGSESRELASPRRPSLNSLRAANTKALEALASPKRPSVSTARVSKDSFELSAVLDEAAMALQLRRVCCFQARSEAKARPLRNSPASRMSCTRNGDASRR